MRCAGADGRAACVPDDLALGAHGAARDGAEDVLVEVGGVVHGVLEVDELQGGDEGAGLGVGAARQADAHGLALRLRGTSREMDVWL